MSQPTGRATVRVPATSANLGPGFDCLGLALDLYLKVDCQTTEAGLSITIGGSEASGSISLGATNLVYRALSVVFRTAGAALPGIRLHIDNGIPLSRGLGSSAAAVVAGLMLGNRLLGEPFDRQRLLGIGLPLEGHPDNLAPALFGGLTTSAIIDGEPLAIQIALNRDPRVVLFIPDLVMSTKEARAVLPNTV
ncbi:MAG: homoserine kinase, partial [Chloroflexota bacterium]